MIRGFLYGLFALGLFINIWSNVSTYHQAQLTIETNEVLHHSYKVLRQIDIVKLGFHDLRLKETSYPEVRKELIELSQMVQSLKLKSNASHLAELTNPELATQRAQNLLSEMTKFEESLVTERETKAKNSEIKSVERIIYSSAIDFLLIIITFSSFLYEKQFAVKMQKSLGAALSHVQAVNESLQQNIIKKESMLKTTVHDLKNPLGSIKGFAEILAEESDDKKSVIEMTQIIQRISSNALTLVGSLLRTEEKTESDKNEIISIAECLKETCDFLEPSMRKKGQKINFESSFHDFTFLGSRHEIQDVFYNIIGNALKFSPPSSAVSISCINAQDYHTVQVKDCGPGFAQEDFSKLFIPGEKLSARPSGGEDSTCIGLYSVKKSVEKFHGQIEVTNNATQGACVAIKFPVG